jgi:hypothetical protein
MPASKTKRIPIYTPHSALFCCLGALCPLPISPTLKGTVVLRFPEEELTSFREDTFSAVGCIEAMGPLACLTCCYSGWHLWHITYNCRVGGAAEEPRKKEGILRC